ncbi:DNA ligase D [Thalassobacillus pellis]|uniref:DNA ligase D n=1 Tax=Thalassobacillus pellis TaxID=748008 RepID=UPI0019618741|nr:DNA ligase D [Thalassobacillus pellis]MBM7551196.1 bifunctional non-homologous end joining protein LigD [Thalassobacillus pellis]
MKKPEKVMKPILSEKIPSGREWLYEVKYDGFRCLLHWKKDDIQLISRNGISFTDQFPEIISFCEDKTDEISDLLPLSLDGELVILNTELQANFSMLQKRSRMRSKKSIEQISRDRPAHFLAFDLLDTKKAIYQHRKKNLVKVFQSLNLPREISMESPLGYVQSSDNYETLFRKLDEHMGEGIVAKNKHSHYREGKRPDWLKIKNWRTLTGILTSFHPSNDYFGIAVYDDGNLLSIGKCKHGLDDKDRDTLRKFVREQGEKQGQTYLLPPAICMDIHCLGIHDKELREPSFAAFRLDQEVEACTRDKLNWQLSMPPEINYTNLDKLLYPESGVTKQLLIGYLREVYPYMKPFLDNRILTVIRFPDGVKGEAFYQKHLPEYAPDFIKATKEKTQLIDSVEALAWFGNQAAIEYHVPFQQSNSKYPSEIVFDLDPPDDNSFDMAVNAATQLHAIFNNLGLHHFVKTSGGKGLQVYLPLPENTLSYEETAKFTEIIAETLVQYDPDSFTTERLKKNRHGRLYVDHIQHAPGKTIIAPYSPRGREQASVATPIYWAELPEISDPSIFTIHNTLDRLHEKGCPFRTFHEVKNKQPMNVFDRFIK